MSLDTQTLQAAELAGGRGDWADAARIYQELSISQPDTPQLQLRLGRALREAGQYAEADAAYTRALGLQPANPKLLLELADFFRQAGRPAEALALYRSTISRLPGETTAEQEARRLQALVPPGFTADISGRLVLARRARALGDLAGAAQHYTAVLQVLPELEEVRQRLAECGPHAPPATTETPGAAPSQPDPAETPGAQSARPQRLEAVLDAEAQPWCVILNGAAAPLPPPALEETGPIAFPPLLEAYLHGDLPAAAGRIARDARHRAAFEAVLMREARLRDLVSAAPADAIALLPGLNAAPSLAEAGRQAASVGYFAPEAVWFRHLLRQAVATGQPLPEPATLPLAQLRFEPDLIFALADQRDVPALLRLPIITRDGGLFFSVVDTCLKQADAARGVPLANMAEVYFRRRGDLFKGLEFSLKAGALLQNANQRDAAVACYTRVLADAEDSHMLLAGLQSALQVLGESQATATLLPILAQRDDKIIAAGLLLLFERSGGRGDVLQRRAIDLLSEVLTGAGRPSIRVPIAAIGAPALLSHALRHGSAGLPNSKALQPALRQVAAFASAFTDLDASELHLKDLLAAGDQDGIAAIGAFITRRYGQRFLHGQHDRITTILGSGNVGDTLLYMAGFAAFALASGQPVHVLHRAGRSALTEFFGTIPGLTFEAIPNDLQIPVPLSLNRLAKGDVSLFYEVPWFHGHELPRLEQRSRDANFLWQKIIAVLLSGAPMLPQKIALQRPPMGPPPQWNDAARRRFAELGLKRGRTVFLSPLANTLFSLTPSRFNHFRDFWQEAIRLFRQAGFTVAANATNNNQAESLFPDAGVPELNLDLRELPAFVAECGYFAGVRSGLCDLLALCGLDDVQSRTLYMRDGEHCIGLADFGMSEVVADFGRHSPRDLAASLFADWLAARR